MGNMTGTVKFVATREWVDESPGSVWDDVAILLGRNFAIIKSRKFTDRIEANVTDEVVFEIVKDRLEALGYTVVRDERPQASTQEIGRFLGHET